MSRIFRLDVVIFFVFFAQLVGADVVKPRLDGVFERIGKVDEAVERQYRELGVVLVPPVLVDELLIFPKRGTKSDAVFRLRLNASFEHEIELPNAGVVLALESLGRVSEEDGALVLRRIVTLSGEGSSSFQAEQSDRFSIDRQGSDEWLVVQTDIRWGRKKLFGRTESVKYQSLVRFRKINEAKD